MDLIPELLQKDLRHFLESEGHVFERENTLCPFHADKNPSLHVNIKDGVGLWFCHSCKSGGNIISWVMKKQGLSKAGAIKFLAEKFNLNNGKPEVIATYVYEDEEGRELYKVLRFKPKAFKADRKMTGVRQVLYHLPEVLAGDKVWLVEGEKDADNVRALGLTATTAPFGVSHWNSSFAEPLKRKAVRICLDRGYEHEAQARARAIAKVAREVKVINLSGLAKDEDISDWIGQYDAQEPEDIRHELERIAEEASVFSPGKQNCPAIRNEFISAYVNYGFTVTDAPRIFHLFSALALLSAVGNKFWFAFPRRTPLNLYILLLAPSTIYRKSVCIDMAGDYLERVNPKLVFPETFTSEALLEILSKRLNRGLVSWRELIQVKEFQFGSDYNRGLPSLLTDLYDFKDRIRRWTKGEGETIVEKPTLSILAGGITTWLLEGLKKVDFMGGIWTRFLFIPAPEEENRKYRLPNAFTTLPFIEERLKAIDQREENELSLDKIKGPLHAWGEQHMRVAQTIHNPLLQAGFMRLEVMLIKIAALLQLAEDPNSTDVMPEAFHEAVGYIEWVKEAMPKFFEEEIAFTTEGKNEAVVIKWLRSRGPIDRTTLIKVTNLKARELDKTVAELQAEERVNCYPENKAAGKTGRPRTLYELIE